MAAVVAVPLLGRDMAGGVVAEWYLPDGARVDAGDAVCRLECDFVAVEVEAEAPGVLRHRRPAGSIERPGTVLGVVLGPGEAMPSEESFATRPSTDVSEPEEHGAHAATAVADYDEPLPPPPPAMASGEPIVVPFRRRSADKPLDESWGSVPGDSATFDSSLFEEGPKAEVLGEPGTSIPGLPLWEPEELPEHFEHETPTPGALAVDARFVRTASEAASSAQILSIQVRADATEVVRAVRVLAREWHGFGAEPLVEDLLLRAVCRALEDRRIESSPAGLVIGDFESETSVAIADPLGRDLREAANAREFGGDEPFEHAAFVLVSLAQLGIECVQPRLKPGNALAVGAGAVVDGRVTLTMSFDSSFVGETEAGRILARVRQLVEEPYGLFA